MQYEKLYENKNERYFTHERQELLPFVPAGIKKALDVGCGNGAFGALLKSRFDCLVWGVEPGKQAAKLAGQKIDRVINNLFTKDLRELAGEKFDAIFFNDVLEHLVDPEEALITCKELLSPDGCIIASIPNIRWYPVILSLLRYKDFKYEPAGVMDKTHLRFFTKKSMGRLFQSAGYHVLQIEGINKHNDFTYFNILNFLLFNSQQDMKYMQFVVVAKSDGTNG